MTSTTNGGIEQRVFMHYKSLKGDIVWIKDYDCNKDCPGFPSHGGLIKHMHGHNELTTPNSDWLLLARVHKMPVRRIKDIVSAKRGWKP